MRKNITVHTNLFTCMYRLKILATKNNNFIIQSLARTYLFSLDVWRTKNILVWPNAYPCEVLSSNGGVWGMWVCILFFSLCLVYCINNIVVQVMLASIQSSETHPFLTPTPILHCYLYMEYSLIVGISFLLVKKLSLNIIHFINSHSFWIFYYTCNYMYACFNQLTV